MKKTGMMHLGRALSAGLVMAMILGGCGSSDSYATSASKGAGASYAVNAPMEAATEAYSDDYDYGYAEEAMYDNGTGSTAQAPETQNTNRKLIRTANLSVETKEFDQLMNTLTGKVNELGGYIENMETYNGSSYSYYYDSSARNASLTLRIPASRLDEFLSCVSDISNVVRKSENVSDVTLSYVDTQAHKDSLETEKQRLLELLEMAEDLDEVLTIEDRLTSVRYQIESMERQLRTYDNEVDYSTVYMSISEVKELTVVEEEEKTPLQRMREGFLENLEDVGDAIVEFFVWLVSHLPALIIWAGIIIVVIVIWKKTLGKRAKERRAAKKAEKAAQKAAQDAARAAARPQNMPQNMPPMGPGAPVPPAGAAPTPYGAPVPPAPGPAPKADAPESDEKK